MLKALWPHARPYSKWICLGVLCSAAEAVFELLIPLVMLFFGRRFLTKPPKSINSLYGYRTARSMKNQQTWDFAHRVCGKLWSRAGAVMLPLSLLAMLPALGRGTEETGMWCIPVTGVQLAVLVGSMFPVERALKENFDQFGRKR